MKFYKNLWRLSLKCEISTAIVFLVYLIEAVQHFSLLFPNHGWNYFTYQEFFLINLKTILGYTILEVNQNLNHMRYLRGSLEWIMLFYLLIILCYLFFLKYIPKKLISKGNCYICLSLRFIKLIFYNVIIQEIVVEKKSYLLAELIIFCLIQVIFIYFQRNIYLQDENEISLYLTYRPLNFIIQAFELVLLFISHSIMDSQYLKIVIFTFAIYIFNYCKIQYFLKAQNNQNISFIRIYILFYFLQAVIFSFIVLKIDEKNLFFFLSFIGSLIYSVIYTIVNIKHKKIWQSKEKNKKNVIETLQIIVEQLKITKDETYLIFGITYLYQKQYYTKAIETYFDYSKSIKMTYFFRIYSSIILKQIRKALKKLNDQNLSISELQHQLYISDQFKEQVYEIIVMEQNHFSSLLYAIQNIYDIETSLLKISNKIVHLTNFLKRHNIINKQTQIFYYLKISYFYYAYIEQDQIQAFKYKKDLFHQFQYSKSFDVKLERNEAVLLEVDFNRNNGLILNQSKKLNKFFGYSKQYQLEFLYQLIPEYLQPHHGNIVQQAIDRLSTKPKQLNNVLALREDKYVEQVTLSITISQNVEQFALLALITKTKTNKVQIIFNIYGEILEMTDNFHYFEIPFIKKTKILIQSYTQNIFQEINNENYGAKRIQLILTDRERFKNISRCLENLGRHYNDQDFHFAAKLTKIKYDESYYFNLELISREADQPEKNDQHQILRKDQLEFEMQHSQEGSLVNSDSIFSKIFQDTFKNKSVGFNLYSIIKMSILYTFGMLLGMTIIYFVLGANHSVMKDYAKFLLTPLELNKVYSESTTYGVLLYLQDQLKFSDYLMNQFIEETDILKSNLQYNMNEFQNNLIEIEKQGYSQSILIKELEGEHYTTTYSDLIVDIGFHIYTIITNTIQDEEFLDASAFFVLNIVRIQDFTYILVDQFKNFIFDYVDTILLQWFLVTISGIFGLIIPQVIFIYFWYKQEQLQMKFLQIQSRLSNESVYKIIEMKEAMLGLLQPQQQDSQNKRNIQYKTFYSLISLSKNTVTQEINQNKLNRYIYDKIKKKQISLWSKIILSVVFYLVVFVVFIMGNELFVLNSSDYKPVQDLYIGFIKFNLEIDNLNSLALLVKAKKSYLKKISEIEEIESIDDELLLNQFQVVYERNIWKPINFLKNITLSTIISDEDKTVLYDLYKSSFCIHLSDKIPFCNQNSEEIIKEYGQFDEIDNNYLVISNGILGFIGEIQLYIQQYYQSELVSNSYGDDDEEALASKQFNNIVIQFHLNVTSAFAYFLQILSLILENLIQTQQLVMQFYCIGAMGGYALFFTIIQSYFVMAGYDRYVKSRIALSIIPLEYLHDRNNIIQLKQLSQEK